MDTNKTIVGLFGDRRNDLGADYEAPQLTAIGNLHDLLAGDGGTSCDSIPDEPTGGHDPAGQC